MTRRSIALVVGLALAVAAAVGGTIAVTGLGDGGAAKPDGDETVVRLQPQDGTVECGAGPVPVYIYLDDLEARPSALDATASYGVVSFQILLRYDPAVVRIAEPIDVQLNPALSTEDGDDDGIVRSFFPVSSIDDGGGRAGLGFSSLVPSSQGGDDNLEEGLDPVARGEPLLLMTVRFLPVGEGRTAIELEPDDSYLPQVERVRLLDASVRPYEPIDFRGTELTVQGGDCPSGPFATPRPTPPSTSTPFVPPTVTPVPWSSVTPLDAVEAGRSDCPQDWVAYMDSQERFSICYPADFGATASDFAVNVNSADRVIDGPVYSFSMAVSWSARPRSIYYPPSPESCPNYAGGGANQSGEFLELSLSDRVVPACLIRGHLLESNPPIPSANLLGTVPLAADGSEREGYVLFSVGFTAADVVPVPTIALEALATLVVSFR